VTAPVVRLLAHYRVRIGFVAAALALWLATPTRASLALGGAVAIAGEIIRIWAAGHLDKGREVTATGPYRLTRHPLYLGSAIMGIGFAIASANWLTAALIVVYLVMTLSSAMSSEERHLTEKFGPAYPEYREGRAPEVTRRFSLTRVVANREYRAVGGLAFALALLAWKTL